MAERIVNAWKRGTDVTIDLVTDWNYWQDINAPLAEVRARYHVAL